MYNNRLENRKPVATHVINQVFLDLNEERFSSADGCELFRQPSSASEVKFS